MMILLRGITITIVLALMWQFIVVAFNLPPYILPSPILVLKSLQQYSGLILQQSLPTVIEATLGFILSGFLGTLSALILIYFRPVRLWFLPILLISQALPTFAIAPLLVIWFGYGITAKIITTILMLFFPITSAFYDGLRRTPQGYLDLAQTMNANKWQTLQRIRIPAALPSLGNGLRVAATFAPMGAIIGEWVGASKGLGFLILNANARMQIDLMFASLLVLVVLTLAFYFAIDLLIKSVISWEIEKMNIKNLSVSLFLLFFSSAFATKQQPLIVVLDWFINPNHAPLFVASKKVSSNNKVLKLNSFLLPIHLKEKKWLRLIKQISR